MRTPAMITAFAPTHTLLPDSNFPEFFRSFLNAPPDFDSMLAGNDNDIRAEDGSVADLYATRTLDVTIKAQCYPFAKINSAFGIQFIDHEPATVIEAHMI